MATLGKLASRLEEKLVKLNEFNNRRAQNVAEAIVTDLIYVTPVDKSVALSNWQISLNEKPVEQLPAYFSGKKGSTANESSSAALAAALQKLGEKKPGETIYISNLTPYIVDLNNGTSKQEPKGFVERAIVVGRAAASNKVEAK